MDKENPLLELKNEVEKELNEFFNDKTKQAKSKEKPEELLEMIGNLKEFVLSGGKRIRPILFCCGYFIAGGRKKADILKAAVSIELIHSYFLIHDDIIDEDDFRHNDLSMHCKYKKEYENKFKRWKLKNSREKLQSNDSFSENSLEHFGVSMAILAGDFASSLGHEALTCSNFPSDLKIRAVEKLNQIILNTITGEAMDVVLAEYPDVNADEIIKMQGYKTAKYTIEGPLHLGAILARADKKFLKSISEFAVPLGIAFQIQDDIIGVFGNKKRIGKPVGADIKEGKKTLLLVKALERADQKQLKILSESFGNRNISLNEIDAVREIIKKTGSLEYSLEKIKGLIEFSKMRFEEVKISQEYKKSLLELVDFIVKRKF